MAYRIINIEPNSPEHFEFRKGKIGASMAASIIGCGFLTRLELWEEIVFDKKRPPSGAMRRGIELEPKAREWINDQTGLIYKPIIIQSIEHPWRIASLDGFVEVDGHTKIVEIKCAGKLDHEFAQKNGVPIHYVPQCQHIMDVAGIDSMLYLSFDGEKGVALAVEKDEIFCKKLFKEEEKFYQRIMGFNPPEPSQEDWIRVDDEKKTTKAERWRELDLLKDEIQAEMDQIERELTDELPHPRCLIGSLKAMKITPKGKIDYKKIESLSSMDLEPYRKKGVPYWKISL